LVKEPQAIEFTGKNLHPTRGFISRPEHALDIDPRRVNLQRREGK
jgi:hypothetical protein